MCDTVFKTLIINIIIVIGVIDWLKLHFWLN